jgi:hypothetical protein
MEMISTTWFDRMNRYRIAAAFLYVPFLGQLGAWIDGTELRNVLPVVVTRSIYWAGLFLLTVALAMDAWEVYAGRRRVKRLINRKKQERPTGKHAKAGKTEGS